MKKRLWLTGTLALCIACAPMQALTKTALPCAGQVLETGLLERYPSYACDAESGAWSVRSNEADALLERFWSEGTQYVESLCVFALELEGNSRTGVETPVLRFYYRCGGTPLNVRAVSVLVDGVQAVFAAQSSVIRQGRRTAEQISVPLTQEAMAFIQTLEESESVSLRLLGDAVYTTEIQRGSTNARRQMEAASIEGIRPAVRLLEEAGMSGYALWDLSAASWEEAHGFAPAFEKHAVSHQIGEAETPDAFGMVLPGERTQAAKAAQQALIDGGFLSGKPGAEWDEEACAAARRAQHYLGRIETGCMDAALLEALKEGRTQAQPQEWTLQAIEDTAEMTLTRYWFAGGVSAARGKGGIRTVANQDNVLLAADGWIASLSKEPLRLLTQLEAKVIYEDTYAYEATVLCERDGGGELDMTMLPLAQARLLVYAEVPAHIARRTDASWRIVISANGQTLEYELE